MSVAPGRPKPLTHPLGGQRTARSGEAWGQFHVKPSTAWNMAWRAWLMTWPFQASVSV